MSNAKIFLISENATGLQPMTETTYVTEGELQRLLAEYPDLIPGDQVDPENPRRWLFIGREVGIPAAAGEGGWWSLDHLFIDHESIPTFIECKRATDSRTRREVMSEESRLGREAIETAYALKQLITAGVRVFFYLEDRERTFESPTDKLLMSVAAFADEREREKARQRTADAMVRKAKAGHVTGGRVFGYANVEVFGALGQRSHVERQINEREAAVVRRIFEMSAQGQGVRAIAKVLNAEGEPAPRAQQGRPVAWAPSSVWAVLRRPLYRGEVVWNQTKKRDSWGRKHQQPRDSSEWLRHDRPDLRIVPELLWQAAHERLSGAKEDYLRRNAGRTWGRPTNGTESKYLLTGLAQCGRCNGGLCVQSRQHGGRRAFFYACSTYYHRGSSLCENSQAIPMGLINHEVLEAFRAQLLNPVVIERALSKLADRLERAPDNSDREKLEAEQRRVRGEIERLTSALAVGGALTSLLEAIREREQRLEHIAAGLASLSTTAGAFDVPIDVVMPEVRRRLHDWRAVLGDESTQARQMLRSLLRGRLVFTPTERRGVRFRGEGDISGVLAGLIDSQALASPTGIGRLWYPVERDVRLAA